MSEPIDLEKWNAENPPGTRIRYWSGPCVGHAADFGAKADGSPLFLGDARTKLLAAVEILRGVPWTFVLITPDGSGWSRRVL